MTCSAHYITFDDILNEDNLNLAFEHLSHKHDSCGLDGIKLSELNEFWKVNSDSIELALRDGK